MVGWEGVKIVTRELVVRLKGWAPVAQKASQAFVNVIN